MKAQRLTAALLIILVACTYTSCFQNGMVFLSEKLEIAANPNLAEWIPPYF